MNLEYNKPFRDKAGNVVTMKSVATMRDKDTLQVISHTVQVNENDVRYRPEELIPMTDQEYNDYLDDINQEEEAV